MCQSWSIANYLTQKHYGYICHRVEKIGRPYIRAKSWKEWLIWHILSEETNNYSFYVYNENIRSDYFSHGRRNFADIGDDLSNFPF